MQEPIYFLSGFYFPVRSLGAVVGGVGSLIPLTLGLDAIRQLILPGTPQFIPLSVEVLAVVAQIIAYAALSQISLRYLERQARQDARLILRSTSAPPSASGGGSITPTFPPFPVTPTSRDPWL